jgi:3-hydroxybutyryl-CoA dehydrogenase
MLARLRLVGDLKNLAEVPFVIEAITEEVVAKEALYRQIEPHLNKSAIVATNTSSLSVRELSTEFEHPSRFVGTHFFNPPDVMKLVEVRGSSLTSKKTLEEACSMATRLGRYPLIVPDEPGYYVNRILFPMLIEGIKVLESSKQSPKDIDDAMKLGANMPMGPLELCDYIGLDIVMDICHILRERTHEDRFEPPKLLVKMVAEGRLGRKSGEGVYKY